MRGGPLKLFYLLVAVFGGIAFLGWRHVYDMTGIHRWKKINVGQQRITGESRGEAYLADDSNRSSTAHARDAAEGDTTQMCKSSLKEYSDNHAAKGLNWWMCPTLHNILWSCLKPLRQGIEPLPNYYLHNSTAQQDALYKSASVAFLHFPKSGGTSIDEFVVNLSKDVYGKRKVHDVRHCMDFYNLAYDLALTRGRVFMVSKRVYGLHEFAYPKRPFLYFAWFRHPTDRFVSQYYYLRNFPNENKEIKRSANITDFLMMTKGRHIHVTDNFVVRLLQFGDHRDNDDSFEARDGGTVPGVTDAPEITEKHFLAARRNLLNHIAYVGLLEDFKLSQDMLCHVLGTDCPGEPIHKNTNDKRPQAELSNFEREEIIRRNMWDLKLYDIAVDIYNKQKERYLSVIKNT